MQRLPDAVDVSLLPVDADSHPAVWLPQVRAAVQRTRRRLFILFTGSAAGRLPCEALLLLTAAVLEVAAQEARPCLDVVPLFPAAGWDVLAAGSAPGQQQAEVLQGLQVVFAPTAPADEAGASLGGSAEGGRDNGRGAGAKAAQTGGGSGAAPSAAQGGSKPRRFGRDHKAQEQPRQQGPAKDQRQQQAAEPSAGDVSCVIALAEALSAGQPQQVAVAMLQPAPPSEGSQEPPAEVGGGADTQCWGHVAVGGTFDRLHAGHRILLAAAALSATDTVYIGVTGPALLRNKKHAELLETYERREAAAREYVQRVRPGMRVRTAKLHDAKGLAAEVEAIQALVVSQETAGGAKAINEDRTARGFTPLEVLSVGLVGAAGGAAAKLSSTELRAREAAASEGGASQAGGDW